MAFTYGYIRSCDILVVCVEHSFCLHENVCLTLVDRNLGQSSLKLLLVITVVTEIPFSNAFTVR